LVDLFEQNIHPLAQTVLKCLHVVQPHFYVSELLYLMVYKNCKY